MIHRPTGPLARIATFTTISAVILGASMVLGVVVGSTRIHLLDALTGADEAASQILFHARLPRVLLAVLTGSALSLAGVTFQALLRNPLATPYTLGISSGATAWAALEMDAPAPGTQLRANVCRQRRHASELSAWSPMAKGFLEHAFFGTWTFR